MLKIYLWLTDYIETTLWLIKETKKQEQELVKKINERLENANKH